MNKNLWDLFTLTGDLRYYILMKEIENYGDKESKGSSN